MHEDAVIVAGDVENGIACLLAKDVRVEEMREGQRWLLINLFTWRVDEGGVGEVVSLPNHMTQGCSKLFFAFYSSRLSCVTIHSTNAFLLGLTPQIGKTLMALCNMPVATLFGSATARRRVYLFWPWSAKLRGAFLSLRCWQGICSRRLL